MTEINQKLTRRGSGVARAIVNNYSYANVVLREIYPVEIKNGEILPHGLRLNTPEHGVPSPKRAEHLQELFSSRLPLQI